MLLRLRSEVEGSKGGSWTAGRPRDEEGVRQDDRIDLKRV